jgi:anhydro-N-acetylmuramic acid kinase
MGKVMRALGLMSGTSLDGIDVALIDTDGENHVVRGPSMTFPYGAPMRQLLVKAIADAVHLKDRRDRPGNLPHAERELTEHHGAAVSAFLRKQGIKREDIDVIGFHGQTVLHRGPLAELRLTASGEPYDELKRGLTIQLGLGEMLADFTRRPVVYDLRAADVVAGGQGAPLVPVYHQALTAKIEQRPLAIVNIGGVANVTWIGRDARLLAFDAGPGNALIDDWMMGRTGSAFDDAGETAARGSVHRDILCACLNHPFFAHMPPKSLDRNAFGLEHADGLSVEDGAATLAAITAGAIAKAREHMPEEPALWIIAGGGRRNKTIMRFLAETVQNAVVPAEAVGINGDSLEAEAWAYLAVRSMRGLPITFPGTTGVASPTTGGVLVKPRTYLVN